MATGPCSLSVIEERFFLCAVCLNPLKEPKLLPCLHRYCRDCLDGIIIKGGESFNCPLCNKLCKTPTGGAEGFKTDFYIKNVVEFIQLQISFKQDNVKFCLGCGEVQDVIAYCFKCKSFLCDKWYHFHLENHMVSDHRNHVLNLKTVETSNFSLEKLASLTEDPRCHIHAKHVAQLCCGTCGNIPVCVGCTYGEHRGHELLEVKLLAKAEREKLKIQLGEINQYKTSLYELPGKVETAKQKFDALVSEKVAKLRSQHKKKSQDIAEDVEQNHAELARRKSDINKRREEEINHVNAQLEEEMERLRIRYEGILKEKGHIFDDEVRQTEDELGGRNDKLLNQSRSLDGRLETLEGHVDTTKTDIHRQFEEISDHTKHTINRYENFAALTTTIMASNDEWTDARCLPDMYAATEPLLEDVKREFSLLGVTSDPSIVDLPASFFDSVSVTDHPSTIVDIPGHRDTAWNVTGMTSTRDGNIVLGGCQSDTSTHITVLNTAVEEVRQERIAMTEVESNHEHGRFCSAMKGPQEVRVATVCGSNQVGLYDVVTGGHVKKDIRDVDVKWPRWATCVATDREGRIYVGGVGKDVLVFDEDLDFRHVLKMPDAIKDVRDIRVHDGSLVVCSMLGKSVSKCTMEGSSADLIFEFPKPTYDDSDWGPVSVCTDSNSFVYILWWSSRHRLLTQYSQDGRRLLWASRVDDDAQCVATLEAGREEKLLLATYSTGKLYMFDLVP